MFSKTIYKKDTKGALRFLTIRVEGADLVQESGILGTENPVEHRRVVKGKNIGKANETTPEQQAIKEAESKVKEKLRKDYFETKEEAETEELILPMLAQEWAKAGDGINWAAKNENYSQPKYDGMRCLAICGPGGTVNLISREGVDIMEAHGNSMQHIVDELSQLTESIVLDGELYVHGENFEQNMQFVKSYKAGKSERIKLVVYDQLVHTDADFRTRWNDLYRFFNRYDMKSVVQSKIHLLTGRKDLDHQHANNLNLGYEGTIVRKASGKYKINGRSSDLIKFKDFKDIACKIVEIGPAKKRPTWARPVVEWNGKRFACSTKMSVAQREEMLTNKEEYIGKTAEVRYFEEYSSGVPRHPIMVGIRLDK